MKRPVYAHIASRIVAMENCQKSGNAEWLAKHQDAIDEIIDATLPSGSGIDQGTRLDFEASKPNRLVFVIAFHHMDSNGYYDGWSNFELIVTPSLSWGIDLRFTGRDRDGAKEYLYHVYQDALTAEIEDADIFTPKEVNS